MQDIRPSQRSLPKPPQPILQLDMPEISSLEQGPSQPSLKNPKRRLTKRFLWWSLGVTVGLVLVLAASAYLWYAAALRPVANAPAEKTRIQIASGSSPSDMGKLLEAKKLIHSQLAFDLYTWLSGNRSKLQAGIYSLTPSQSTDEIVAHLASGNIDKFSITFLPGATLAENRMELIKAGYSASEVDTALGKSYEHPLFASRPASATLEGYIYGETYTFTSSATVEQILSRTFDEFYANLKNNNLITGFEAQGVNLYQAITLASIIQSEVSGTSDRKQVAQIFFTRLRMGMMLGSDVTYQYAAKKLGVAPSSNLDSPYNTRKYAGLPPGPISTPGFTALEAVAAPANGSYIYFLSGDDNITYFAYTNDEQVANIRNHCKIKCLAP